MSEELKNFRLSGVTLNLDERMQLEAGLDSLRPSIECDELLFWGKICGLTNDYFVATSLRYRGMFEFPVKTFYWALSTDFVFKPLPELLPEHDEKVDRLKQFFFGEPTKVVVSVRPEGEEEEEEAPVVEDEEEDGEPKVVDSDASEEEEVQAPPQNLTEIDRLAAVVRAIENDCHIAPVGAFKMTAQHEMRRNEAFRGLAGSGE